MLDDNGANALFWAAYGGNPDIVQLLIDRGGCVVLKRVKIFFSRD
jgi:ankyrin repeat protein